MTTYGSVNGLWTAGSYDLCTTILRKEWGFDGIVMTDWWAKSNYEGHQAEAPVKAPMVAAQNDCPVRPEWKSCRTPSPSASQVSHRAGRRLA